MITAVFAIGTGMAVVLLGGLSLKYRVAVMFGLLGTGFLLLSPDRRILSLILWILIMPLSIEKVFYVAPPVWSGFVAQAITINAGDMLLALLFVFLLAKSQLTGEKAFYWPTVATAWLLLLSWATISYLIHRFYLQDGLVSSSPLALLRLLKILIFIVLIHSAVRSRGDVILAITAVLVIVLFESILVGLSYITGHIFNFTSLTGGKPILGLQKYSGPASSLVRGTGTLGQTNNTAHFETFYSLILLAMFGLKNRLLRIMALITMLAAGMAILLSFSRGAWLSFALAILAAFFIFLRRHEISKGAWLTGSSIAMLAVLVLAMLASPIMDRLSSTGSDGAIASRLRMFHVAFDLARAYPIIGVGPGEYAQAGLKLQSPRFTTPQWVPLGQKPIVPLVGKLDVVTLAERGRPPLRLPLPVHNKFLLVLSQLGVVGLILWFALYGYFLRDALRCFHAQDKLYRFVGVAGIAYCVAALVYMNVDLFSDSQTVEVLIFIPVLITAVARLSRTTNTEYAE
ncbi:MAG: O-antigen ligase family protein [Acidiferrobacteraceae bacterium]